MMSFFAPLATTSLPFVLLADLSGMPDLMCGGWGSVEWHLACILCKCPLFVNDSGV